MEAHADQGLSHQPVAFGHGRVGMPITTDSFLGIHSACPGGYHETGSLSGNCRIENVRQIEAEINPIKAHGVHGKRVDSESEGRIAGLVWALELPPRLRVLIRRTIDSICHIWISVAHGWGSAGRFVEI